MNVSVGVSSTSSVSTDPGYATLRPTPNCSLIVNHHHDDMGERAALLLAARILQDPTTTFGFTIGVTPTATYQHLSSIVRRGLVSLNKCHFVLFDEFFSSDDSSKPESPHYRQLSQVFLTPSGVQQHHIHRPDGRLTPQQALASFTEIVRVRQPDVLVLGVGTNGVIGWNQNHLSRTTGVHLVDMSFATTVEHQGYSHCVSLGPKDILAAKEIILLAAARNKAQTIKEILADTEGTSICSWIVHNHPKVTFLIDRLAAAALELEPEEPCASSIQGFTILSSPTWFTSKKIVCFSPHPDDTSISAGATLAFLSENNQTVSCICTTGYRAYIPNTTTAERIAIREAEATEEAKLLGALAHFLRLPLYSRGIWGEEDVAIMAAYLREHLPKVIILPHTGDSHPTHRAVLRTILEALGQTIGEFAEPVELLLYEGPWSLFPRHAYNFIASVPPECFAKKLAAIRAHVSQTGRTPYDQASDALALLRGSLIPEQDLAGFGHNPPKLESRLELFYHRTVASKADLVGLIAWFDAEQAPSTKPTA